MSRFMTVIRALTAAVAMLLMMTATTSCVHEFPEIPDTRTVVLTVSHDMNWSYYDQVVSRDAGDAPDYVVRYHFNITDPDDPSRVIRTETQYSRDLTRADFVTTLDVPVGTYSVWVWSDLADAGTGKSCNYDSSDMSQIVYTQPYSGNDDRRDAFRGMTTVTVEPSTDADLRCEGHIDLERPLAKYRFVATDLREFVEREVSRNPHLSRNPGDTPVMTPVEIAPILAEYHVKVLYTGYMPSVFNNYINRPVDSDTGVMYEGDMQILNSDEAMLCFDYVKVNGHESSIPVRIEIYDKDDKLISRTNPINVSIVRNRFTTVRGRFMTSMASGGVGINPDFDGEYNVEIR